MIFLSDFCGKSWQIDSGNTAVPCHPYCAWQYGRSPADWPDHSFIMWKPSQHPTSSSYHHLVGIFPRCHPPEWDSVWGPQGSWHNLNVANFTGQRCLQQCEPNWSGTTCPQYSLVSLAGCANLWGRTWGSGRNLGQNITLDSGKGNRTHEWRTMESLCVQFRWCCLERRCVLGHSSGRSKGLTRCCNRRKKFRHLLYLDGLGIACVRYHPSY